MVNGSSGNVSVELQQNEVSVSAPCYTGNCRSSRSWHHYYVAGPALL